MSIMTFKGTCDWIRQKTKDRGESLTEAEIQAMAKSFFDRAEREGICTVSKNRKRVKPVNGGFRA